MPQSPGNFDYSSGEWVRISTAVSKVRSDALSGIERDALRVAAREYVCEMVRRTKSAKPTSGVARKEWRKIRDALDKIRKGIKKAAALDDAYHRYETDSDGSRRRFFASEQFLNAAGVSITEREGWSLEDRFMTLTEVDDILVWLREQAVSHATHLTFGAARCWTFTGRTEPRVPYLQQVLWLWTHQFGGRLTVTVDSTSLGTSVQGDLVDYISAVTGPVMKGAAPKASGLPDVIKRQKEFYAWLAEYKLKIKSEIRPWAYERAVAMREASRAHMEVPASI